jgi:hypothetical protein
MGMLQTARLSAQAQIENLNFGDDDLVDMVKFQRGKIDFYEQEYSKLKEENRKLKAICSFNDVDYKQEVLETEYSDVLEYTEDIIQQQKDDLEIFNSMIQNVKSITTMDHIEETIEEKKNIEKQKILNDVVKE